MKAKSVEKNRRGRPRGNLRTWYTKNLPKMRPVNVNKSVTKEVEVFIPTLETAVTIDVPKGYAVIPAELTEGKSQATIGQTARNETKQLNIEDKRFIVHQMNYELEDKKKTYEFQVFALETVKTEK